MIARKFSLLRQLVWAATLATGFGTLWFVPAVGLATLIEYVWQGGWRYGARQDVLMVRSDGTPLIRTFPADNRSVVTDRDLKGDVQDAASIDEFLPGVYLSGAGRAPGFFSSRIGWEQRLIALGNQQEPAVTWYFLDDGKLHGAGYFVGYDSENNRRVGFIGLAGFRSNPVPVDEWIPVLGKFIEHPPGSPTPALVYSEREWVFRLDRGDRPPRWMYVPSRNQLRKIDLAARTVTTVFETPEPIESAGIPRHSFNTAATTMMEQPILVRTSQQIHVLDHKHNVRRVFAIPAEVDRASPAYWYEIGDGQAIVDFVQPWSPGQPDNVTRHAVYRIAANGAIQDRFELMLQSGSRATIKQAQAFHLGVPAPAIVFFVDLILEFVVDQPRSYPAAVTSLLKDYGPCLIAVLALSTILAVMAWRRSRTFGRSPREQIAWSLFVLLFGVPAYAGFLLYRRWPSRLPCPHCHTRAPRDRVACAECGTRFPDPALKGIEIFA